MVKKLFGLIVCCYSIMSVLANDTLFFKHNAILVESREGAVLYKLTEVVNGNSNQILETTYSIDNQVVVRVFYIDYQNRIKHGDELFYRENSTLGRKIQYINGLRNGVENRYGKNGELVRQSLYRDGISIADTLLIHPDSLGRAYNLNWMEDMPISNKCMDEENQEEREYCTALEIQDFIGKNTQYPSAVADQGIGGRIYIRYFVNNEGTVSGVTVVGSVKGGEILEKEAIRVVSALPKMIPGSQYGESVHVQYTVPVNFRLENGVGSLNNSALYDVHQLSAARQREFRDRGLNSQNVDRMPIWKGCHLKGSYETQDDCTEWRLGKYVNKNVIYPDEWKPEKKRALCVVNFEVDEHGKVGNIQNIDESNVPKGMHEAAVAVVKSIPDFIPATFNGESTSFTFSVSIRFKY